VVSELVLVPRIEWSVSIEKKIFLRRKGESLSQREAIWWGWRGRYSLQGDSNFPVVVVELQLPFPFHIERLPPSELGLVEEVRPC
jgi:hypothetical protein